MLSEALSLACHSSSRSQRSLPQRLERFSSPRERYEQFVYKLAYTISFNIGGGTVSALTAVVGGDGSIVYPFAGNLLSEGNGERIKNYIETLLRDVARAGSSLSKESRYRLLFKVLLFARPKVESYLKSLASHATALLDSYLVHRPACEYSIIG